MKVKFGAIIVDGSGKIGGHVVASNRGGKYMRTKVTPNNPRTTYQLGVRAQFASLSTTWAGLTAAERLGWNKGVADWSTTDVFGDIKNPSGFNLFMKLNGNLGAIGQLFLLVCPAKVEVPFSAIQSVTLDISSNTSTILFADNSLDAANLLVSATASVSAGRSNVANLFRNIGSGPVSDNELVLAGSYATKFGTPGLNSNISFKIEVIMPNGQKSTAQTIVATIVA